MTQARETTGSTGLSYANFVVPLETNANLPPYAPSSTSKTSSLYQTMVVENVPGLLAHHNFKSTDKNVAFGNFVPKNKNSWLGSVRGVMCLSPRKKKAYMSNKHSGVTPSPWGLTDDKGGSSWASPYIPLVYVYPNREDKGAETIPKFGKCTIDTGCLQGNIVSHEFVVSVLEYPPERFHKLTKDEEEGGTGITGDAHIPLGAVYLTWYHPNSTKVFRNMRFLVSPHSNCDIIIGARDIQRHGILNVPCLMTGHGSNRSFYKPDPTQDGVYIALNADMQTQISELQTTRNEVIGLARKDTRAKLPGRVLDLASLMVDVEFYHLMIDLYQVLHSREIATNEAKMVQAQPLWEEINNIMARKKGEEAVNDRDVICGALKKKIPSDDLGFERLWQPLTAKYPLSNKLKTKLDKDGQLAMFWKSLEARYDLCSKSH